MEFPEELIFQTAGGTMRFVLAPENTAIHMGPATAEPLEGELFRLAPDIVVCQKQLTEINRLMPKAVATGVYRTGENGPLAVPTGLVFVRLSSDQDLQARSPDLAAAGFEIDKISSAGKNAGWVRHVSGQIDQSLQDFPALSQLADAVVVEPQMLMPAGRRR